MRSIKFRAWDIKCKEMVQVHQLMWDKTVFHSLTHISGGAYLHNQKGYILQQFTGLYDVNRKEIYEGDILKGTNVIAEVKYDIKTASFYCQKGQIYMNPESWEFKEIIGNFCQNPELVDYKI